MDRQENKRRRVLQIWEWRRRLWDWEWRRRMALAYVVCLVAYWLILRRRPQRRQVTYSISSLSLERRSVRDELMREIIGNKKCRDIIRMGPGAFLDLCDMLRKEGGLQPTQRATIEEQVAKFLYILSHGVTHREISFFFRRSGETINRHFHQVLRSVIQLEEKFLKQPDGSQTSIEILNSSRFFPYFKDCIGAIDGTHIRAKVSIEDAPRYRRRKDYPTQNVLAACAFDLKFTYVLPGWEGTASDSRILKNALSRRDKLKVPQGKYYLVDAGFMLRSTLLAPYRGIRYHLKEYSRNPPQNPKELFNLRHASLRNAIERAFGVLKKRFPIIASSNEPSYGVPTQKKKILACCILDNYLMGADPDDRILREVDEEILNNPEPHEQLGAQRERNNEDAAQGEILRNSIETDMWRDYTSNPT